MNRDLRPDSDHVVQRDVVREHEESAEAPPAVARPRVEAEELAQSGAGIERRERVVRDDLGVERGESVMRDVQGERRYGLYTLSQILWFCLGVIEVLIGLRVLLRVIAANPSNDFARFIYRAAGFFLAPFFGLTGSPAAGGSVLEIPSLVAMVVYAVLFWGLIQLVWLFDRPETRGGSTYHRYRL